MRSDIRAVLAALVLAAAACGSERVYDGPQLRLAVAGRANDNVSATAHGNVVALSWSAATNEAMDVYAAVSRDGGASFGVAHRVNTVPGDARVGGEQPPRAVLIAGRDGILHPLVVWTRADPAGTRIVWSSTADDTVFSAPALVPGADGAGNRGWESITRDDSGHVFALWLDHREVANTPVAPMHRHGAGGSPMSEKSAMAPGPAENASPDPVEQAEHSRLWFSSVDGTVPPRAITGGVCYCCKTALAVSGNRIVAAWRHVYPGEQRDIAFTQSMNGGRSFSAPVRVSEDHWKFDGCPENGPAIAIDSSGVVHVAWVTPRDGTAGAPLALYTASTTDGATFSTRRLLPTAGAVAHVQLVAGHDGNLTLAWDEATPMGRVVRVAHGTVDGDKTVFGRSVTMPGVGDHPALAAADSGTIVAWVRKDASPWSIGVIRVP